MAEQAAHNRWVLGSNPSRPILLNSQYMKTAVPLLGTAVLLCDAKSDSVAGLLLATRNTGKQEIIEPFFSKQLSTPSVRGAMFESKS